MENYEMPIGLGMALALNPEGQRFIKCRAYGVRFPYA